MNIQKKRKTNSKTFKPKINLFPSTPFTLKENYDYSSNSALLPIDILTKNWFLSFTSLENEEINYGPLSSYKVFLFLQNFLSLNSENKNNNNLLIIDLLIN